MRKLRVLRRLLVKYRASGKIDKHLYHELYHLSKGNTFKHKRALVEHVRFSSIQISHHSRDDFLTYMNRSTRPRPRRPAPVLSRRRWMLSVRRPRLHVRGDRSVLQESGMRSLLVTRLRRRSLRHRRVSWKTCLKRLGTNGASIMNDTYCCWHDGQRSHALRSASSTSGQKMGRSSCRGNTSLVDDMLFSFHLSNMLATCCAWISCY